MYIDDVLYSQPTTIQLGYGSHQVSVFGTEIDPSYYSYIVCEYGQEQTQYNENAATIPINENTFCIAAFDNQHPDLIDGIGNANPPEATEQQTPLGNFQSPLGKKILCIPITKAGYYYKHWELTYAGNKLIYLNPYSMIPTPPLPFVITGIYAQSP